MKVSKFIAKYLEKQGVTHVFEMSGGMITHLLDSIYLEGKIQIISTHHEQAAAFAAEGFARMNGIPGVAFATSGPGATNLITGIGSCYFDSTPAVFITGQVNRNEQKGNLPIRQLGFQETDIISIVAPITKAVFKINEADEIPKIFEIAFEIALSGRPGPVLIDITMDLQREELDDDSVKDILHNHHLINSKKVDIKEMGLFYEKLFKAIKISKKPLVLVGGGIRSGGSHEACIKFINNLNIPVVYSLMGVDILPHNHPLKIGMIGSYGNRWANLAIAESDFILVLGSRLDIRQTGGNTESFKEGRTIFHVDCDEGELNNRIKDCTILKADISDFFEYCNKNINISKKENFSIWIKYLHELKKLWLDIHELKDCSGINPNIFMHKLSNFSKGVKAFIVDVGQHQMWAAQSLELESYQRFLTSGGMGSMGFALPSAIGASLSKIKKIPVMVIAGDGGLQLNIQELETIKYNKLPIKIVVLNNQSYGMVRQFQESYFESRFQSTVWGYSAPSFSKLGEAYGIESKTISKPEEIESALLWLNNDQTKPALLEVAIDPLLNVYPKLAFGKKFGEMEPQIKPTEMEGT